MNGAAPWMSIVVAGNGPPGARAALLANLEGQGGSGVELVAGEPAGGTADSWNRAAGSARGDFILFLRDDFTPASNLVTDHRRLHQECPDVLGVGTITWDSDRGRLARYLAGRQEDVAGLFSDREDIPLLACCGATLSMSRERFQAAGGFGPGLDWGAEAELALRVTQAGARLVRMPAIVGRRKVAEPRQLAALAEQSGRASVELYRRAPAILPHLELGAFSACSAPARLLRRTLLAARCPPRPLAAIGSLVPGRLGGAWQRFFLGYCYWRGVWGALPDRDTRRRLARGPIILMYHAIGGPGERPGAYLVSAKAFARQLAWLRWRGYQPITMTELLRYRREHQLPPARSVVITFDDGYADNHRLALPLLRARGMVGTFFLVTRRIDEINSWDRNGELAGRQLMSRGQIRELIRGGMEIGAHTRHHAALPNLDPEEMERQIVGSLRDLQGALGVDPSAFAYPYGLHDEASRRLVEAAGFQGACASRPGVNDPVVPDYLLRRVAVRGTDSLLHFAIATWRGRSTARRSKP